MSSAVVHNLAWDFPLAWVGAINSISPWLQVNKLFINLPTPDFNNLFIVPVTPSVHTTACTSADCLGQLHLAVHHELRPPLLQLARLTPRWRTPPVATQPKQPTTQPPISKSQNIYTTQWMWFVMAIYTPQYMWDCSDEYHYSPSQALPHCVHCQESNHALIISWSHPVNQSVKKHTAGVFNNIMLLLFDHEPSFQTTSITTDSIIQQRRTIGVCSALGACSHSGMQQPFKSK